MEMGQEAVAAAVGSATPLRMGAPPPTCLAPGFRFHPTDEELVRYYLRRKVCGKPFRFQAVAEIDVYKSEPWELAEYSALKTRDLEWYFFSPVDRKYGSGSRLNRATAQGYWKATGKDRSVLHMNLTIGMKKTLVFHSGRAPEGKRTNWVMHEYRLCDSELETAGIIQDAFVLCRIFQKSGMGPPNGDRYAPFIEEEWDEDAPLVIPGGDVEDDLPNGDEAPGECMDFDQDTQTLSIAPPLVVYPVEWRCIPFLSKRKEPEPEPEPEPAPLPLIQSKRAKHADPSSSKTNGSEDSSTTSQDPSSMMMTISEEPFEFPLLETVGSKDNLPLKPLSFDLENSINPGYLKYMSNLEKEILEITKEKEALKIEVMRARAMINILQSRVDTLTRENHA